MTELFSTNRLSNEVYIATNVRLLADSAFDWQNESYSRVEYAAQLQNVRSSRDTTEQLDSNVIQSERGGRCFLHLHLLLFLDAPRHEDMTWDGPRLSRGSSSRTRIYI